MTEKKYKHLFFDFDDTLWDFRHNSRSSLIDIYKSFNLSDYFDNFESFFEKYKQNNNKLWSEYRHGLISKEVLGIRRFSEILKEKQLCDNNSLAKKINAEYLIQTTTKTKTINNAYELLNYLKNKYQIHILTDGFFEVQMVKLRASKLSGFVSNVITAEEIGCLKPNKALFDYAINLVDAQKDETIMIGDSYQNDIIGAYDAGIDQIFLNHEKRTDFSIKPTFVVSNLLEIMDIL